MTAVALAALAALLLSPMTRAATSSPSAAVSFSVALTLIRSTLISLQQADDTGNYAVMSALGAQAFRTANPPQQLAAQFTSLRTFNLSSVLTNEPKFTQLPVVDAEGRLSMAGYYALDPYVLRFSLGYLPEKGRWRLSGIAVSLDQLQSAVDAPPQP